MYADPLKYLSMRIPDLVSLSYPVVYLRGESSMQFLEFAQKTSFLKFCPI